MPKPQRVDRPQEKSLSLRQSLCAQVDLLLYSEIEEKVPHGAWARYVEGLIEADLWRRKADALKKQAPASN